MTTKETHSGKPRPGGRNPAVPASPEGNVRRRAGLQAVIMAAIGTFVILVWQHRVAGAIVLVLAGAVLFSGLFFPPLFLRGERLGRRFGRLVGVALTWVLLPPFFYLCCVPARVIMALRRRDPLSRSFPTDQPTYWADRPPTNDKEIYRRQYG